MDSALSTISNLLSDIPLIYCDTQTMHNYLDALSAVPEASSVLAKGPVPLFLAVVRECCLFSCRTRIPKIRSGVTMNAQMKKHVDADSKGGRRSKYPN